MKILWITLDYYEHARRGHSFRHYYHALENRICEIADVTFSGRNGFAADIQEQAEEIDADFVMFFTNVFNNKDNFKNIDKLTVPKGVMCSDPWRSILNHVEWINKEDFDLVFLYHGAAMPEYQKRVKARCIKLFSAVEADLFKEKGLERIYDVFFTGNISPETYPLRNAIYYTYHKNPRCWVRAGDKSIPTLEGYIETMGQSKIMATENCHEPLLGKRDYAFFQPKAVEGMATKTMIMMDTPTCAEDLHLVPGEDFVEIDRTNFRKRIRYYLKNEEERKAIAQRGHETFLKYHSAEAQAARVLEHFKEVI